MRPPSPPLEPVFGELVSFPRCPARFSPLSPFHSMLLLCYLLLPSFLSFFPILSYRGISPRLLPPPFSKIPLPATATSTPAAIIIRKLARQISILSLFISRPGGWRRERVFLILIDPNYSPSPFGMLLWRNLFRRKFSKRWGMGGRLFFPNRRTSNYQQIRNGPWDRAEHPRCPTTSLFTPRSSVRAQSVIAAKTNDTPPRCPLVGRSPRNATRNISFPIFPSWRIVIFSKTKESIKRDALFFKSILNNTLLN